MSQTGVGIFDNVVYTHEVIDNLNDVTDFYWFKSLLDFVCVKQIFHLDSRKTVACHSAVAVGEVDLYVRVDPIFDMFFFLLQM